MGLGLISLLKARGYADIVAVDLRQEARVNAKKFGATEVYHPDELPDAYKLNWQNWNKPDLTRDGHKTDIFNIGFQTVVEFAGTESALKLASEMVCAHGTLGIAGFHNDDMRILDFKLLNMKAAKMFNCHERRIEYEATLVARAMKLLSSGQWKFTGVTNHIYDASDFDKANEDMAVHKGNFIKGAVKF
jgi:threonine dehydrogenase-like Zn-dependent dehydrogenase